MRIIPETYPKEVEDLMKKHYDSLTEKDKRRYAAIESSKIDYYGELYISKLLNISIPTIRFGRKELLNGSNTPEDRIRNVGAGRKKILDNNKELREEFIKVIVNNTAGSPMDENIKWTNLTSLEISKKLAERGFHASDYIVKQLLKEHGYVKRKAKKDKTMKNVENRDEQFQNIDKFKQKYIDSEVNPVVSLDVKKRTIR
jgi:hypothetical protein